MKFPVTPVQLICDPCQNDQHDKCPGRDGRPFWPDSATKAYICKCAQKEHKG